VCLKSRKNFFITLRDEEIREQMEQKPYDILNRPSLEEFKNQEKYPVVLVLDNLRSGLNIGSAFRTGDAFGIQSIELCGICATPPHKEILKTALGATNSVNWNYHQSTEECLGSLKQIGFKLMAVEMTTGSVSLEDCNFEVNQKTALVFGNEVMGIDKPVLELCDGAIEIPQIGTKHSFNISVSLGIVLWEYFRQVRKVRNA